MDNVQNCGNVLADIRVDIRVDSHKALELCQRLGLVLFCNSEYPLSKPELYFGEALQTYKGPMAEYYTLIVAPAELEFREPSELAELALDSLRECVKDVKLDTLKQRRIALKIQLEDLERSIRSKETPDPE